MDLTRDEAAKALDEVSRASDRIVALKGYNQGAPYFIVWGLVWLVANSVTQFWPGQVTLAWGAGVSFGVIASTLLGVWQSRTTGREASPASDTKTGSRIAMTSMIAFAFIGCVIFISRPESSREANAVISIFFPFLYMGFGVWTGWRLFAIGFVTAAGIMAGYVWIGEYYPLWMGLFGGGSLIAGGLWLRSA